MIKFVKRLTGMLVISGLLLEAFPVWALTKDETIYAKLDNNGQVSKVVVTEHLQKTNEGTTNDKTRLSNITNINGEETFTNENGSLTWNSKGKDIIYQGTTNEELPISLNIKYYLNGEETTVKDMLGKKGTVKMVFKYTNNDKHTEVVNGRNTTLYTPFVVATTTIIPNTVNSNINVTNGKVIGNGTSSVVIMLSTPGLYESLGIDKLKGMDQAVLTFDTESFSLSSIYSVATPKIVESSDLDIFNNIDKIYDSINTLVSSSKKIKSGSSQLLQGAESLKAGIQKLHDGINKLYNGSKQIKDGLSSSINNLNNSSAIDEQTLNGIATQSVNGAKASVESKFTNDYKAAIGNQAVETLRENNDYKKLKAGVNQAIAKYESIPGFTDLVTVCTAEEIPEAYLETCQTNNENIQSYMLFKSIIGALETSVKNTAINTAEQTAIKTAEETASGISKSVATKVAENAKNSTITSLQTLLGGITQITDGLYEVNSKMIDLDEGTASLKNGIYSLDSGIGQFNSQGMDKISSLVNGDLKSLEGKLKALVKLSEKYQTFDERTGETTGTTKIIMVVDEIKAPVANITPTDKKEIDNESLWDKIKGLFK